MSRFRRGKNVCRHALELEQLEERLVPATWAGDLPAGVTTWSNTEVHLLTNTVRVPAGATLVIEPNAVVKVTNFLGLSLIVDGTLDAQGSAAQPIIFTSNRDDVREDTNGDGSATTPVAGSWNALQFRSGSSNNVLAHVEVRYAGAGGVGGAVVVNNAPLTLSDSLIRHSSSAGLRIQSASPTVTNITFQANALAASMNLAANPTFSGVTMNGNTVNALELDGGTLPGNATWDDPDIVYLLSDNVTVPSGRTLTVGAGQIVKVPAFAFIGLTVEGTLTADGTDVAPIIFTGGRDDVGGDLLNDGQLELFSAQWNGIRFQSGSVGNVLDHVEVRYAGRGYAGAVVVNNAELTLTNSTLLTSATAGLRIQSANPVVTGVTLQGNNIAATMDLASNPDISDVAVIANSFNALQLDGGTLPGNAFWHDPDIVYLLSDNVTVPAGRTLTVGAGQIVKVPAFAFIGLTVEGTLTADGTDVAPIVFTGGRDDVGGDLLNDGQLELLAAQWNGIRFQSGSVDNVLDHVEVRYAGRGYAGAVVVNNAELTLTNSTLLTSATAGLRIELANPTVTGTTFQGNAVAATMDLASDPAISDVTLTGNAVNALQLDGGNLVGNRAWDDPDIVYYVPASVTVPAGQTLTVAPGQIVKTVEFGNQGLTVAGTLLAEGTPSAPVLFTSGRDDVGGDLRNDGQLSLPVGQWLGLRFHNGSSGSVLDGVEIRYAGGFAGAVLVEGAALTVKNSTIHQSSTHGVLARSAATVRLESNVLHRNTDTGVRVESGATVTALNNTIDANFRGAAVNAGTLTLTNNLLTNNTRSGVFRESSGTLNVRFNDVFNPSASGGNYEGIASQTGSNGNVAVDPLYVNQSVAQYRLTDASPVIDAGTSDDVPATDFLGNARFDDPLAPNTGGGAQPFVDLGAFERPEPPTFTVDLATTSVSGPATGVQDQTATVQWSVTNLGTDPAEAPWRDAVYLSADAVYSPDDLLLKEVTHLDDLPAGQSYSDSTTVALPGVLPGDYFFIVRTNSRNEVPEGARILNNAAAAGTPVALDLPALQLGTPTTGQLSATGDQKRYRVTVPAGSDLSVTLSGPSGVAHELYVAFGDVPSRQSFDVRGVRAGSANQSVTLANARGGDYYILVHGANVPGAETFTLTATTPGFSLSSVSPARGSNLGQVTVTLLGAQLDADARAELIDSAGNIVTATQVYFVDSGHLSATFDLRGWPLGLADVRVVNADNSSVTLPDAFNVIAGQAGRLVTSVTAPSQVRLNRNFRITVEYANEGDADLLAPIIHLGTTQGQTPLSFQPDLSNAAAALDLVAVNPVGPAGILPPGARGSIVVYANAATSVSDRLQLTIGDYPATPIDWDAIKPNLRPEDEDLSNADYDALFARLRQNIGDTWDDYHRVIADNATLFPALRGVNYSLVNLLQVEYDRAFAQLHASVSGRLVLGDTDQPLGNVAFQLYDGDNQEYLDGVTFNDGTFFVPDVSPGTCVVSFTGYVPQGDLTLTVSEAGLADVTLVADFGGSIDGALLTADGTPVPHEAVVALADNGTAVATTTDEQGRYRLDGLPDGVYTVGAGASSFVEVARAGVAVSGGSVRRNVNLMLRPGGSVSGTVIGPDGPVADALVVAAGADGDTYTAVTAANGTFSLLGLPAGDYTLRAVQDGLIGAAVSGITLTDEVRGVALMLSAAGTITGQVVSAVDESPVGGVFLSIEGGAGTFSTQTDAAGTFSVTGLPSGTYTLRTTSDAVMVTTMQVAVVAGQSVPVTLTATPLGVVSGVVSVAATGAPLAQVVVHALDGSEIVASTVTDAGGAYTLTGFAAGTFTLIVGDVGSPGVARTTVTFDAAHAEREADLAVSVAGIVTGTIREADGVTAAAEAFVTLVQAGTDVLTMQADEQGRYSFIVVAAGTYEIHASAPGVLFAPLSVTVGGGATLSGRDLQAGADVLTGSVTELASGAPLAEASVVLSADGAPRAALTTAADGTFRLTGALPGSYQLVASLPGHAFAIQNDVVSSGVPASVSLSLGAESRVSGTIRGAVSGPGLADALVSAIATDNHRLGTTARSDEAGHYLLSGLAPGTYDLLVTVAGRETTILRNVSLAVGTNPLDVVLAAPTVAVTGTVTGAVGSLSGVTVTAVDASGLIVDQALTTVDGSYLLSRLPAGSYTVLASAPGYETATLPLTVSAGQTVSAVDFSIVAVAISDPPLDGPAAAQVAGGSILDPLLVKPDFNPLLTAAIETARNLPCSLFPIQNKVTDATAALNRAYRDWATEWEKANKLRLGESAAGAVALFADLQELFQRRRGEFLGAFVNLPQELLNEGPIRELFRQYSQIQARLVSDLKLQLSPGPAQARLEAALRVLARSQELLAVLDSLETLLLFRAQTYPDDRRDFNALFEAGTALRNRTNALAEIQNVVGVVWDAVVKVEQKQQAYEKARNDFLIAYTAFAVCKACEGVLISVPNFRQGSSRLLVAPTHGDHGHDHGSSFHSALGGPRCTRTPQMPEDEPLGAPDPVDTPTMPETAAPVSRPGPSTPVEIRSSFDPNDLTGPAGFGPEGFIQPGTFPYRVDFENDPNLATAAAQIVTVTLAFDADLDADTFEFTSFGFGTRSFSVPAGLSRYETTVDLRPEGINLLVPVTLNLDRAAGVITALFESLDPLTRTPPDGIDDGFLPVNNANRDGEGFFTFQVRPLADRPTGTDIDLQATIVFDSNAPILTPTAHNTLDLGSPTGTVTALPARTSSASFTVTWTSSDDAGGSGVAFHDLFVSTDGGPFVPLLLGTPNTSTSFAGEAGRRYTFYVGATDNVGRREASIVQNEATTSTPPGGVEDVYAIAKDRKLTVVAPGVLANDRTAISGALSAILVGRPRQGKVTLNSNGSFTYKPKLTAKAPDSFTYRVRDSQGVESELVTVRLLPQVEFVSAAVTQSEATTTVKVPVKLSIASTQAVSIAYAVTGGSATRGGDYLLADGVLTIPAGKTKGKIVFSVVNDRVDELNETIQLTLSNPSNALLGTRTTHTYTIRDDDPAAALQQDKFSGLDDDALTAIAISFLLGRARGEPAA